MSLYNSSWYMFKLKIGHRAYIENNNGHLDMRRYPPKDAHGAGLYYYLVIIRKSSEPFCFQLGYLQLMANHWRKPIISTIFSSIHIFLCIFLGPSCVVQVSEGINETEERKLSILDNVYIIHGIMGYTQTTDLEYKSANFVCVTRGDRIKLWS